MSGKFYFDCYNTTCTSSSVSTNDTQTQCSVCGKVSITPDNNGALTAVPNGFLPIQVSMISGNDKTGTFDSSGRLCIVASWVGPSVRGLPITIDACAAVVNAAAARVEAVCVDFSIADLETTSIPIFTVYPLKAFHCCGIVKSHTESPHPVLWLCTGLYQRHHREEIAIYTLDITCVQLSLFARQFAL